jgi:hypothetical protein
VSDHPAPFLRLRPIGLALRGATPPQEEGSFGNRPLLEVQFQISDFGFDMHQLSDFKISLRTIFHD